MRHKVKAELFKVFLENATAELNNRHIYAVDKRLGSSILEHPAVEEGQPIMLIHPADFARILSKYLILGDSLEWKKGKFTTTKDREDVVMSSQLGFPINDEKVKGDE